MTEIRLIPTPTHGRYLVRPPAAPGPAPALIGFHGYAEPAEIMLERLAAIPGAERWLLVAVQGLHRFYRGRSNDVVASWMTRQDREAAIADNVAFVGAVLGAIEREWPVSPPLVFAGFSQGVAMAFRAACAAPRPARVIALGADVPPELDRAALGRIPAALVGRGRSDVSYAHVVWTTDSSRLRQAGVEVRPFEFDGGHDWTAEFGSAAGEFLTHSM